MHATAGSGMTERIDQRRIPGQNRLFADYLYEFARVAAWFSGGAPYDAARLADSARALPYPAARRAAMAGELARQNRQWGAAPATLTLLDRFAQPDAVAVVTGQQVGFLGGPLLGLLKAMTAVRLAERLRERGVNAVPLFWMASQDHDLAEVDHAWLLDRESRPLRVVAPLEPAPTDAPVGALRLAGGASAVPGEAVAAAGLAAQPLADLEASYRPGATLAEAFARLMSRWMSDWGLLLFDPLDSPAAAALAAPLYLRVLARQADLAAALAQRDRALTAAGYVPQVKQNHGATLLFLHRDGRRLPLRPAAGGAYTAGDATVDAAAVRAWIERDPLAVSPAALLRPVVQDTLFPTLAAVTGPAETAYLAQAGALYPPLDARQPAVWPRASATVADARVQRLLRRFELGLEDVWSGRVDECLARRSLPAGVGRRVGALRQSVQSGFATLADELRAMDPTLIDAAATAARKIEHQLEQLEGRVGRSLTRRSEEIQRHARALAGCLFPGGSLQERVLCVAALETAAAVPLTQRLHEALALDSPDHQVIAI